MKAILVFAGALMTGASIYGIANYNQLSKDKDFRDLYSEKKEVRKPETQAPVKENSLINNEKKTEAVIAEVKLNKKAPAVKKKVKGHTNIIKKEKRKPETVISEEPDPQIEKVSVKETEEVKTEQITAKPTKTKKLRREMFSRAALRE